MSWSAWTPQNRCVLLLIPLLQLAALPTARACIVCTHEAQPECCGGLFSCDGQYTCQACDPQEYCEANTVLGPCQGVVGSIILPLPMALEDSCVRCTLVNYTNGEACTTDNLCTTDSLCQADGTCGAPTVCGAGDACTTEECNPATGNCDMVDRDDGTPCSTVASSSPCRHSACIDGTCVPDAADAPPGTLCNDDDSCTGDDACTVDGKCVGTALASCSTSTSSLSGTQQALLIIGGASALGLGIGSVVYLHRRRDTQGKSDSASSGSKDASAVPADGSRQRKPGSQSHKPRKPSRGASKAAGASDRAVYTKSFQLP